MDKTLRKQIIDIFFPSQEYYKRCVETDVWYEIPQRHLEKLFDQLEKIITEREVKAVFDTKVVLIKVFHKTLEELYGKDFANMIMSRVNETYTAVSKSLEDQQDKEKE